MTANELKEAYLKQNIELSDSELEFLNTSLASKKWRMNNLYTIYDKNNNKRIMRLNLSQQRVLYEFQHNRKIILKSRQQGISTLFLAYYLDSCLFKPGYQAGIQSYGLDESAKLQKRALLMWEELDPAVKKLLNLELVSNNSKGMTFSNGATLKIGNFRGDTLQGLHVSEMAKIAKYYPDKAHELVTGAFQAIGTKGKITVESTAEGNSGLFYDMWHKAKRRTKLTPLDFQPIFLPWTDDPDCNLDDEFQPEPWMLEELEALKPHLSKPLTQTQLNWYFAKLYELEDKFNQEYPATPELAFAQSVDGTYFKHQYDRLLKDERVGYFPHIQGFPVDLAMDLGMNDEFTIVFAQKLPGQPRVINYYENSGQGIEYYADILNALAEKYGYTYGRIYLPHDAQVRELGTGLSRLEMFRKLGFRNISIVKKLSFADSIQATRTLLDNIALDEKHAQDLITSIQMYRKKYDQRLGVYLDKDVHDEHSHRIAALRYLAHGWRYSTITRPPIEPKRYSEKRFRRKKRSNYTSFNIY